MSMSKKTQLSAYIDESLADQVRELAERDERPSISFTMQKLIRIGLEQIRTSNK